MLDGSFSHVSAFRGGEEGTGDILNFAVCVSVERSFILMKRCSRRKKEDHL